MIFYSPSNFGFYEEDRNSDIPQDAVEVTQKERSALLAGQSAGKVISMDSKGRPALVDRSGPSPELLAERAQSDLARRTEVANAQVLSLAGRVDTLNYLINDGSETPTTDELDELPRREEQLKAWRSYSVALGRLPGSKGWPQSPVWPSAPE